MLAGPAYSRFTARELVEFTSARFGTRPRIKRRFVASGHPQGQSAAGGQPPRLAALVRSPLARAVWCQEALRGLKTVAGNVGQGCRRTVAV